MTSASPGPEQPGRKEKQCPYQGKQPLHCDANEPQR